MCVLHYNGNTQQAMTSFVGPEVTRLTNLRLRYIAVAVFCGRQVRVHHFFVIH